MSEKSSSQRSSKFGTIGQNRKINNSPHEVLRNNTTSSISLTQDNNSQTQPDISHSNALKNKLLKVNFSNECNFRNSLGSDTAGDSTVPTSQETSLNNLHDSMNLQDSMNMENSMNLENGQNLENGVKNNMILQDVKLQENMVDLLETPEQRVKNQEHNPIKLQTFMQPTILKPNQQTQDVHPANPRAGANFDLWSTEFFPRPMRSSIPSIFDAETNISTAAVSDLKWNSF
jgi:hypothetical protein